MKTIFSVLVVLCAAGLAGCGDKDSGAVGTWVADHEAIVVQNREMFLAPAKADVDAMLVQLKELEALPADQREAARKITLDNLPKEQGDLVSAYLRSAADGEAALTRMIVAQAKKMFDATFTANADGTFVGSSREGGDAPEETKGTWAAAGSQVTLTPKTKNGKAVAGDDAKPKTLTLQGNTLSGKTQANGPTIILKRK